MTLIFYYLVFPFIGAALVLKFIKKYGKHEIAEDVRRLCAEKPIEKKWFRSVRRDHKGLRSLGDFETHVEAVDAIYAARKQASADAEEAAFLVLNAKGEALDSFRIHLNLESEQEAFLNEHLYIFERLKADPGAQVNTEAFGGFLEPIDDFDGFIRGIAGSYPKDKHIDTAYFSGFFGQWRKDWPAHAVECYVVLAKRAAAEGRSSKLIEMYLNKARAIAQKNGLPPPQAVSPMPVASTPSAPGPFGASVAGK